MQPLPELREIKQVPIPASYQNGGPQRIKDFLTGFQMAWEIALRLQEGRDPYAPRPEDDEDDVWGAAEVPGDRNKDA